MNYRKKCLLCKKPMARWVYGEPDIDALREQLLNGEIVLGGCCLSNRSPKWACITCCISYRSDGIGYLDHNLIDNYENQDDKWFLLQGKEIDFNPKESKPYKLPEKIQAICSDYFLKENPNKIPEQSLPPEAFSPTIHSDPVDGFFIQFQQKYKILVS
jgi:hypothetical protein